MRACGRIKRKSPADQPPFLPHSWILWGDSLGGLLVKEHTVDDHSLTSSSVWEAQCPLLHGRSQGFWAHELLLCTLPGLQLSLPSNGQSSLGPAGKYLARSSPICASTNIQLTWFLKEICESKKQVHCSPLLALNFWWGNGCESDF